MSTLQRTAFDDWMDELAALVDGKWFYARVAGTDRTNPDGTARQDAIRDLDSPQELVLEPEPDNDYDGNAIKVMTPAGIQAGYLDARLAGETVRRRARGEICRAFVSSLTGRPNVPTHGLVIGVLVHKP